MPASNDLENVILSSGKMPDCPATLSVLAKVLDDPDSTPADLAEIISGDGPLADKVMQVVNSTFTDLARPVHSVEQAGFRLDVREMWSLSVGVGIFNYIQDAGRGIPSGKDMLWEHSLRVAVLARKLAGRAEIESPEEFFAAGALHDIGKVALFCFDSEKYQRIHEKGPLYGPDAVEGEVAAMGMGHTELGGLLLRQWAFPERVVHLVEQHHSPGASGQVDPSFAVLTAADALAHAATRELGDQASGLIRMDYSDNLLTKEVAEVLKLDGAGCIVVTTDAMQLYEDLLGAFQ